MNNKVNVRNYTIVILSFLLCYGFHWRSYPTNVDEKITVLLANGIHYSPIKVVKRLDTTAYADATPISLQSENKIGTVYHNVLHDGGNGELYYVVAHLTSVTVGKIIGVFNSLRLLSCLCALIMTLVFYSTIKNLIDPNTAVWTTIFLISTSVAINVLVRNYALSHLFLMIFFRQLHTYYHYRSNNIPISKIFYVLLLLVILALPFLHFFNVIFIALGIISGILIFTLKRRSIREIIPILSFTAISSIVFFSFYIFINEEGRHYQSIVNNYWKTFADLYGSQYNTWLAPVSARYLFTENAELLLNLAGLDLRSSYIEFRISMLLPILLVPFIVITRGAFIIRKLQANNQLKCTFLYISFIVLAFLAFLNLTYIISGHATALNSQWYASSLNFLIAGLLGISAHLLRNHFVRYIFYSYVLVTLLNSLSFSQSLHKLDGGNAFELNLLEKLEDSTTIK